jgi:uncharacterized membrane protein YgcG
MGHATELRVIVNASVGGRIFSLLAQRYAATGNYQVQDTSTNKDFYKHLSDLGAKVNYITLLNGSWTQVVGPRTLDLTDTTKHYCTTFELTSAPAPPPSRGSAARSVGGGGGGGDGGGGGGGGAGGGAAAKKMGMKKGFQPRKK